MRNENRIMSKFLHLLEFRYFDKNS